MRRNEFIKTSAMAVGAGLMPTTILAETGETEVFNKEEIKDFVFAAHNDFDKSKMLIEKNPLLLNCTNQFKKGDFETALGGASHMGRKDIADLLIGLGARMDVFNMTFIGLTDQVKQMIKAYPQYLNAPGPHGFTLLHHANAGKHVKFASWLQDQGLTETHFKGIFG